MACCAIPASIRGGSKGLEADPPRYSEGTRNTLSPYFLLDEHDEAPAGGWGECVRGPFRSSATMSSNACGGEGGPPHLF